MFTQATDVPVKELNRSDTQRSNCSDQHDVETGPEVPTATYLSQGDRTTSKVSRRNTPTALTPPVPVRDRVCELVSEAVHLQWNNKPETDLSLTEPSVGFVGSGPIP